MTTVPVRTLVIGWLYGSRMNIYGDRGNIVALTRRCAWRGIATEVREIGIGDPISDDIDLFFWGGGQDQEQAIVARDLAGEKAARLRAMIEDGAALLAICGGYQLLGHSYRPHAGEELPGAGVFDIESTAGPERFIGNAVTRTDRWGTLVGFENHSGLTRLGAGVEPLGRVEIGRGNNGEDGTEGAVYRNAIGCYLHGALLPKNPRLADWLLEAALRHRYGDANLVPLDDTIEEQAHASAVRRARIASQVN